MKMFRCLPARCAIALLFAALAGCAGRPVPPAASPAAATAADTAAIEVDQVGYLTAGAKWAAVRADVPATRFAVVDEATGHAVWHGELGPARAWAPARQTFRLADFSGLQRPGRYRLQVDGLPPSAPFRIADDAYAALDAAAVKAYYYNRASTALDAAHAGVWARAAGHPDDHVLVHASAAGPGRPAGTVISAPKGWYDAGDYNKYIVNSGISVYTLLSAYEDFPDLFRGQHLNLPESGNGLPDLLNEALWNLDWMLSMQDPADGGVYHKLTDAGFDGIVMPDQARHVRYVVQKTTAAALDFAAVMADASRVYAPFDAQRPGLSARMLAAAQRAWRWAQAHPDVTYRQPPDIHTGTYADEPLDDEFTWAAAELYLSTGDDAYWRAMPRPAPAVDVPGWGSVGTLAWISLARHPERLTPAADRAAIDRRITDLAARLARQWRDSPYRLAMRTADFDWGSNSIALNQAMVLIQGYRLTGQRDELDAAQAALDDVLGRNPLGASMVTGFGTRSPLHPHHRISAARPWLPPVPGMLVGGPHTVQGDDCQRPYPSNAPALSYLDALCSYTTNEVAINWNAPLVYVAAALQALTPQAGATAASAAADPVEVQARALVDRMTLDEKFSQLLNVSPAIERLGIPAYNWWTEALHGAIGPVPTTNFPEPIGLAATFDAPLVHEVAHAISTEVRALHALGRATGHDDVGLDVWAPNINIFRDPRWGRGQETYGEDPYLTALMGRAYITGLQGPDPRHPDVIATPKHFAVHSGPESTRHVADVIVTPHDLEDTYLPAFRSALVDAHAGSVMCAYNRVNGQPACASEPLLKDRLRDAWHFKGYVVSDCDAVSDIAGTHHYAPDAVSAVAMALKAGVDNECNTHVWGEAAALRQRYKDAYERGLISRADIDRALVRLISARLRTGDLPGVVHKPPVPVSAIGSGAHQMLALKSATESTVLLKNDGVLPLRPDVRIALVGPLADATRVLRGNYSSDRPMAAISLLDGLRQALPSATITQVPFTPSITDGDPVPASALQTSDGRPGLQAAYFSAGADGAYPATPTVTRVEPGVVSSAGVLPALGWRYKVVWTGFLVPPATGHYRIALAGVTGTVGQGTAAVRVATRSGWNAPLDLHDLVLEKGHRYPVRLEAEAGGPAPGLFWKRVTTHLATEMKAALDRADVVVAAVGLTSNLEGEEMALNIPGFQGGDRTSLALPADQRRLLRTAVASGKPVVVVLMNGSAIGLGWASTHAAAIVEAWYPGEAGGLAVARVLSGQADPGGRLPVTFYRDVADLPPFDDYRMQGRTYRYFGGVPVYPFGFGLSYATFDYSGLRVDPVEGVPERGLNVTVTVRNSSGREGDEVAELYLTPPAFPGAPRCALRGVRRVTLAPGEARTLTFHLSPRDLAFVTAAGELRLVPGRYQVSVGAGQPGTGVPGLAANYVLRTTVALPE